MDVIIVLTEKKVFYRKYITKYTHGSRSTTAGKAFHISCFLVFVTDVEGCRRIEVEGFQFLSGNSFINFLTPLL